MATTVSERPPVERERLFITTRWSVIVSARDATSPRRTEALETLCRAYWYPLYALARSWGHAPQDAEDLTQGFFAQLLRHEYLRSATPERGRFRTFMGMALKRHIGHERERSCAQKRGGGGKLASVETADGETRFQTEPMNTLTPDQAYDRRWARALLEETVARLAREYQANGKQMEWGHLRPHLTAERGGIDYAAIAQALGTTEGAARVAVHRMRQRFRDLFRESVEGTLSHPADLEDELRYLVSMLGGG